MLDLKAFFIHDYGNQVKSCRYFKIVLHDICLSRQQHMPLLHGSKNIFGMREDTFPPGLHFNENQRCPISTNNVQLQMTIPPITIQDMVAFGDKKSGSKLLRLLAKIIGFSQANDYYMERVFSPSFTLNVACRPNISV